MNLSFAVPRLQKTSVFFLKNAQPGDFGGFMGFLVFKLNQFL